MMMCDEQLVMSCLFLHNKTLSSVMKGDPDATVRMRVLIIPKDALVKDLHLQLLEVVLIGIEVR